MDPPLLPDHGGQKGPAAQKGSGAVHVQHPPPLRQRHVGEQPLPGDARVVHQHLHKAQVPLGGGGHGLHLALVGHVRLVGEGVAPFFPDGRRQGPGLLRPAAAVDPHPIATLRKGQGDGPPDAPGSPGDQHVLPHSSMSPFS